MPEETSESKNKTILKFVIERQIAFWEIYLRVFQNSIPFLIILMPSTILIKHDIKNYRALDFVLTMSLYYLMLYRFAFGTLQILYRNHVVRLKLAVNDVESINTISGAAGKVKPRRDYIVSLFFLATLYGISFLFKAPTGEAQQYDLPMAEVFLVYAIICTVDLLWDAMYLVELMPYAIEFAKATGKIILRIFASIALVAAIAIAMASVIYLLQTSHQDFLEKEFVGIEMASWVSAAMIFPFFWISSRGIRLIFSRRNANAEQRYDLKYNRIYDRSKFFVLKFLNGVALGLYYNFDRTTPHENSSSILEFFTHPEPLQFAYLSSIAFSLLSVISVPGVFWPGSSKEIFKVAGAVLKK